MDSNLFKAIISADSINYELDQIRDILENGVFPLFDDLVSLYNPTAQY